MNDLVFGINAMLSDMEPVLRRFTGERINLAYRQTAGLWPVRLPAGRLEELLLALALDACEAMGTDGVLRVETANVPASTDCPADCVALQVSDNARQVGDLLRTAVRGGCDRDGRGIRLGLQLAEETGGRLDVRPATGRGVTVSLLIPRAGVAGQPVPILEESRAASETILVVEDDPTMMTATSQVLTRLGYLVLPAASAEMALRRIEEHQGTLELLLTDIILPGMDGLQLARQARTRRPGLKVLYMSGFSEDAVRLREVVDPGVPLVEKPFTSVGLAGAVRSVLGAA